MMRSVHYVGFKDDRFIAALKVFGRPAFIHRAWDRRALREIGKHDIVVFATGDETQPFKSNTPDIIEPATTRNPGS